MTDEEHAFYEKQLGRLKVVPVSRVESLAQYQLCPTSSQRRHHNFPEFVSNCSVCNVPVYFTDSYPHLDKICLACAMKRNPDGFDGYMTPDTLAKLEFAGNAN